MDTIAQKKIYLWSVPRSLSTAVLRGMSTVPGCKAMHQPYINAFYKESKRQPDGIQTAPTATFEEIRDNLKQTFPGHNMVFIKEMTKHLAGRLDDHSYIPQDCIHTFLIRHPVKSMKSYISTLLKMYEKTIPDESERQKAIKEFITEENIRAEQSYEFLYKVFGIVTGVYKQKPVIIDADDLQTDPEGTLKAYCKAVGIEYQDSMVHWGPITPEQKDVYRHRLDYVPDITLTFIGNVLNGTGFTSTKPTEANIEDIDEKFRAIVDENLPIYEKMRDIKTHPI